MDSGNGTDTIPSMTQTQTLNFMVGMLVTCSMYAIYISLFAITTYLVIHESSRSSMHFYLIYIILAFLVYTANISSLLSTDAALLLCTIKDGMPFLLCKITIILTPLSVRRLNINGATSTVITTLADGLSIWRAWILWQKSWLVVLPSIIMLALSISLFGWAAALPDLAPANLTFAEIGLSAGVDLVTTSIIVGRLLYHRRSVRMLGSQHQSQYATLVAIFVESSALVSITRILNAILQFTTDGETSWSQSISNGASCIGPLLVVLRITLKIAHNGRAPRYQSGSTQPASLQFSPNPRGGSTAVKAVITTVIDHPPTFNSQFTRSQDSTAAGSTTHFRDKEGGIESQGSIQMVNLDRAV